MPSLFPVLCWAARAASRERKQHCASVQPQLPRPKADPAPSIASLEDILDARLSMQNSDLEPQIEPLTQLLPPILICRCCSKEHSSATALVIHGLTLAQNQLKCGFCDKIYVEKRGFLKHMQLMHCEVSTEQVNAYLSMLRHFPWRDDDEGLTEQPQQAPALETGLVFTCPLCETTCRYKELLRIHTVVVHGLEGEYVFEELPLGH